MDSIYLDYSSTTPMDLTVVDAMAECYRRVSGNPSSQHQLGRHAKRVLEDAAESIGNHLAARVHQPRPDRVILTSGGTEANNLALLGLPHESPGRLIVSAIEHPSTLAAARELQRRGWQVDFLRVMESGVIDLNHLDELLQRAPSVSLVAVMWANNETGVVQPIQHVVRRCEANDIPVHTDAVQIIGKQPVNFADLGVASMSIAAHKFYGPPGIGALILRSGITRQPILFGGAQQLGLRPGTETVALAVGMRVALEASGPHLALRSAHLRARRDQLEARLLAGRPGSIVNGSAERIASTLNLSFPGLDRQRLLIALDLAGIYCSSGSACASGSSEPSHVLTAMGLSTERVESAIRLSVGVPTTAADVESSADRILKIINQL